MCVSDITASTMSDDDDTKKTGLTNKKDIMKTLPQHTHTQTQEVLRYICQIEQSRDRSYANCDASQSAFAHTCGYIQFIYMCSFCSSDVCTVLNSSKNQKKKKPIVPKYASVSGAFRVLFGGACVCDTTRELTISGNAHLAAFLYAICDIILI